MKITLSKSIIHAFLFISLLSVAASYNNDDDNDKVQPGTSTLIDHGYIAVTVLEHSDFAEDKFEIDAYNNNNF